MLKKLRQSNLFLFIAIVLVTLGVSLSLQQVIAGILEAAGTSVHLGNTGVTVGNDQNLIWGEISGSSSGTGKFMLFQKVGVARENKFTIDHNGNLWSAGNITAEAGKDICVEGGNCLSDISEISFTETDTLQTVTARGASTNQAIAVNNSFTVSGNVGIGTTGPGYKLDVQGGAVNASGGLYWNGQSLDSRYHALNNMNMGGGDAISGMGISTTWDPRPGPVYDRFSINWHTGVSVSAHPNYGGFRVYDGGYPTHAGSVLRMQVSGGQVDIYGNIGATGNGTFAGNVGIGTTGPNAKLEVSGSTTPGIFVASTNYPTTYRTQLGAQAGAQGILVLGNNGANEIRFGTSAVGGAGSIYVNNTADYSAAVNGTLAMHFTSAGNVGIGTTGPGYKLDVQGGAVNASGGLYWNGQSLDSRYHALNNMNMGGGDAISGMGISTTWDPRPGPVYDRFSINWHTGVSVSAHPNYGGFRVYDGGYPTHAGSVLRMQVSGGQVDIYGNIGATGNGTFAGKVGIGTTGPGEKLEINDTSAGTARLRITDTAQNPELQLQYGSGASDHWAFYNSQASDDLRLWGGGADRMTVLQNGNVGIGTTGPGAKLDVAGTIRAQQLCDEAGANCKDISLGWAGGSGDGYSLDAADGSPTDAVYVDNDGRVGIGTTAPGSKLYIATTNDTTPSTVISWDTRHFVVGQQIAGAGGVGISYNDTSDYGIINALSPNVAWRNLVIQSGGGNVGIGTAAPGAKLDVAGTIRAQELCDETGANCKDISLGWAGGSGDGYSLDAADGSPADAVYVDNDGRVGIGTVGAGGAAAKFEIDYGNISNSVSAYFDTTDGSGGSIGFGLGTSAGPYLIGGTKPDGNVRGPYNASRMDFNSSGFNFKTSDETSGARVWDSRMVILNNGNVGIGTLSPGAKLDVAGQIKITGGAPAAGKVLTSDASGLATWQTSASGADNLGNHTATQNIILGSNWLSGDGGSEGIFVNSSGKVGIGTAAPLAKLEVHGNGIAPIGWGDTSNIGYLSFGTGRAIIRAAGSTDLAFEIDGRGELMRITDTGNVGIGEVAPGAKLSVSGGMAVGSSYDTTAVTDGNVIISGNVGIGTTGPTEKLEVNGNIKISTGGTLKFANGQIYNQYNSIFIDPQQDGAVYFRDGGIGTNMYISGVQGKVGIGTTAPTERLDVQGNINTSGNLSAPNNTWGGCHDIPAAADTWANCDSGEYVAGVYLHTDQDYYIQFIRCCDL